MNSKPQQQRAKQERQIKSALQQQQHQDKELRTIKHKLNQSAAGNRRRGAEKPRKTAYQQNQLLASLMDPEKFQGVRWPDGYSAKTAMIPGMVNREIPYFPADSNNEPAGSFNLIIRPSALHPVWTYGKTDQVPGTIYGFVDEQADYGLFPLTEDSPSLGEQCGNMILQAGIEANVKFAASFKTKDWVQEPYKAVDPGGKIFYGQPISGFGTATNPLAVVRVVCSGSGVQAADTLRVRFTDSTGAVVDANIASALGQQVFETAATNIASLVPADNDPQVGRCAARPGVGIRLLYTSATNNSMPIESISIRYYSATELGSRYVMYPYDLDDQAKFLGDVDLHRVVSMSALLTYMGATLTDGGNLAALTYLGGEHPNELNFWNRDGIAQAVNSPYDGPVKTGTYSIWVPRDATDMAMRKVVNNNDWKHPYIVIAGVMSSPDIVNTLRLKVFANYETVTKSRFATQGYGSSNPAHIRSALLHLREFPKNGPNETHLATIRRFLKSAWDTGSKTVSWIYDNKGWLIPAATAAAALL